MGALGFYAPQLKEHGCAGLSYTAYGLIMQELERADFGLRSLASVQGPLTYICHSRLRNAGTTGTLASRTGNRRACRVFRFNGT